MHKLFLPLFIALLLTGQSGFASELDRKAFLANYAVSWNQTKSSYTGCHSEYHPHQHLLLGECPNTRVVDLYYLSTALLHAGAIEVLPKRYSRILEKANMRYYLGVYDRNPQFGIFVSY